jgi:hypothetical protein
LVWRVIKIQWSRVIAVLVNDHCEPFKHGVVIAKDRAVIIAEAGPQNYPVGGKLNETNNVAIG